MGQALYRKYRSKSLDEIVGQEHITTTLAKALKSGRVSHAYLFTGPRGVGKTSVARILAHEINGLPYADDQTHIDIIEIDAASNNGVEDVRDLREKVYVAPALAKYKVYIIDEVHMLSKPAFNALLKTLEEPPAHVVFILATTEAHKLPETIVSRTQRFVFRPIEQAKAVVHLKDIATKEKITVTADALELIAQHGDGSFRDSISLLDQAVSHSSKIDAATVQALLGIPPAQAVKALITAVVQGSGDAAAVVGQLSTLYDQGYQAASIAKQLAATIRSRLVEQPASMDVQTATGLLAKLLEVPVSHNPDRYLEIVLLQALPPAGTSKLSAAPEAPAVSEPLDTPTGKTVQPKPGTRPASKASKSSKPAANAATPEPPVVAVLDESSWPKVLAVLKKQYNTLYGIVRMAKPDFSQPGNVDLAFAFAFHQKRAHESKNLEAISAAITTITGQTVGITCSLNPDLKLDNKKPAAVSELPTLPSPAGGADEPLSAISNIFGGAEVLES